MSAKSFITRSSIFWSSSELTPADVLSAGISALDSHSELTAKYKLSCGLAFKSGLETSPAPPRTVKYLFIFAPYKYS
ncbi:Uncharacterised protein [Chlamydia trachomatis]|nr:Uncharacterised protein [Chlamydia trachomatis]